VAVRRHYLGRRCRSAGAAWRIAASSIARLSRRSDALRSSRSASHSAWPRLAACDPRGELGLMIQWSWRIENTVSILCGSWSEEQLWKPTFDLLRNKTVVDLSVVGRLPEIVVALTKGLYVSSFMTAEGDPQWSLFDRRGGTLRMLRVLDASPRLDVDRRHCHSLACCERVTLRGAIGRVGSEGVTRHLGGS
jgi:hypothetical protein